MTEPKIADLEVTVDGAALLDQARALLTTYCVLPSPEGADAIVLWCAATHALEALPFAPRLSVRSATKRTGKSRVLEIVAALSHRPLITVNATVAAIFRSLGGDHPPTLIFDEVDTLFGSRKVAENNEELRGLLNAGFERGRPTLRCVGPYQTPTAFPSFAMAALAGIGSLPDTIEDRSVIIHMRRRKAAETVKPFRLRRDRPEIEKVGEGLATWLCSNDARTRLTADEPPLSTLEDRAADVWESLLMIADLAGADWPDRARAAARILLADSADDEYDSSLSVKVLHDLREAFQLIKSDHVPTEVLLANLKGMRDSPWSELELTAHRLGRMLRDFSIKPKHNTEKTKRGYWSKDFQDAWERYPASLSTEDAKCETKLSHDQNQAVQASEVSTSVRTHTDQPKQVDGLPDALTDSEKASAEVSTRSRWSSPTRTHSDASDAPHGEELCDRCQAAPIKSDKSGARYCRDCAPHLWKASA